MLTAHSLARRLRGPLGLAADPAYRAALHVANAHDLIDPRGVRSAYTMNAAQMAEAILCACAAGSGITKAFDDFLAAIRLNGSAETLADLIREAEAGNPEHLRESWLAIDATGRCRWTYVECRDASSVAIGLTDFGGKPGPRCAAINGAALADLLA